MSKTPFKSGPEQEPKGGLEAAKTAELSSFLKSLSALRESIKNNEALIQTDVQAIERQASEVHVQIGETAYRLSEAKKDPNVDIWAKIYSNDASCQTWTLTKLPASVVRNAPESFDYWVLTSLPVLEEETARALAERHGTKININMDTGISKTTAQILVNSCKLMNFYDIEHKGRHMTPGWAYLISHNYENFSEVFRQGVRFRCIEELSPEIVKEFFYKKSRKSGWKWLSFPGLKTLDVATAQAMADNRLLPEIYLDPKTRFASEKVAEILSKMPRVKTIDMSLGDLDLRIPFDTDPAYPSWLMEYHLKKCSKATTCIIGSSTFPSTAHIKVARAFKGSFRFGCTSLKPEEARQLLDFQASNIELCMLQELSDETADILAKFPREIEFPYLSELEEIYQEARQRLTKK